MMHTKVHPTTPQGHLLLGGCEARALAEQFGTPLYVMDERRIRGVCAAYKKTMDANCPGGRVSYAGKAFSAKAICRIVHQEGLGLDAVSGGELYTALEAGMPARDITFHGNAKTEEEIRYAVHSGVGCIVIDDESEIELLESAAEQSGTIVTALIRLNPGIEAHTRDAVKTAIEDCKFGIGIENGRAMRAVERILSGSRLALKGFHVHIGSQIFETHPYGMAADALAGFASRVREKTGYLVEELNYGGGFGIRYTASDEPLAPETYLTQLLQSHRLSCERYGLPVLRAAIEPGRSIVGEAGVTLYRVMVVKEIPGVRRYVSVDGGMGDNIRPMLYGAEYEACVADRVSAPRTQQVRIVGRFCETGDILIPSISMPDLAKGDILALFSTGAYCYAMSSQYNRVSTPAVALVRDGEAELIVKRQTYADLARNDIIPEWLK